MRDESERLHSCPLCARPLGELNLGLRDWRWASSAFPGKAGMSDVDAITERNGHFLVLELKRAGESIPLGQRILLKRLVGTGRFTVFVVWEYGPDESDWAVTAGAMNAAGEVPFVERLTLGELSDRLSAWWKSADASPRPPDSP